MSQIKHYFTVSNSSTGWKVKHRSYDRGNDGLLLCNQTFGPYQTKKQAEESKKKIKSDWCD